MDTLQTAKAYTKCLIDLMSFIDGVHYDSSASFSRDQLALITADQVAAYLCKKAYGTPSPGPNDRPRSMRASSLAFQKKAISQFMPLRNMPWDDIHQRGNPTRSSAVNEVITKCKKHEVRQEGVSSKARRALEWEEFRSLLMLARHLYADIDLWFFLTAVLCLQWQIIGRIDDVMKLAKSTLLFNSREPSTLNIKMNWSKNIREERDCPTQVLFGAMDPLVCPLLNLATWLEGGEDPGLLLFGNHRSNRSVSSVLDTIFSSQLFRQIRRGLLGTHSIRKGAASYAARFGPCKDWISTRGRWKGKRQQVDTYIETYLPYPDARVASVLCGPQGPCKYAVKGGDPISDELVKSLVPKIHASFGGEIATVLALPLLWAAFEGNVTVNGYTLPIIPVELASLIKERWIAAGKDPVDNPIEKISLVVQQLGDQLAIIPLNRRPGQAGGDGTVAAPVQQPVGSDGAASEEDGAAIAQGQGPASATAVGSEVFWAGKSALETEVLFSQQFQLQQRLEDLRQEIINLFGGQQRYLQHMNTNVRRIAVQPVARSVVRPSLQPREGGGEVPRGLHGILNREAQTPGTTNRNGSVVKLSKNPKDLYSVWKEWEFGLNGMKAAKDYSYHERGANKFSYCRRKVFWDAVTGLISKGYTSDTAIDRIYLVYGEGRSVCGILKLMARDRRDKVERL